MKMRWNVFLTLIICAGTAGTVTGQATPTFDLGFGGAPASIVDVAGTVIQYGVTGTLTTGGLAEGEPGAQGWSISVGAEGGAIVAATIEGTASEPALNGGFEKTELTTGAGNEGAVSAIVLSFTKPVTLPPTGSSDIVALTVEATVPEVVDPEGEPSCEPLVSRIFYVDGRRGSGQPVDNKVTYRGNTIVPTLGDVSTSICPRIVRPLNVTADLTSPPGTAGEPTSHTPYTALVPVNPGTVPVTTGIFLRSNLPGAAGAQGWSISVATDDCYAISAADITGTASEAALSGGFEKTEVVDPAQNGGQAGAVSAIVLHFTKPVTLPPISDSLILNVVGAIDGSAVSGPGAQTSPPCRVTVVDPGQAGLKGSGQPVKTAVTVGGETKNPGVLGAAITLEGAREGRFVRGNPNDDAKDDIADAIWIINELFRDGDPTLCQDAADANNDGQVDTSDAVYLIDYQFAGGPTPPPPFVDGCGTDPEGDGDGLTCDQSQSRC